MEEKNEEIKKIEENTETHTEIESKWQWIPTDYVWIIAVLTISILGIAYGVLFRSNLIRLISVYFLIIGALAYVIYKCYHFVTIGIDIINEADKVYKYTLGLIIIIFGVIIFFAVFYLLMHTAGIGYLRYGNCSNIQITSTAQINAESMYDKSKIVDDIFGMSYFSTITFATVGYGDICPMGADRYVAMLNSIAAFILAALIGSDLLRKNKKEHNPK
jgi:hypothetical protein